ncbi:MAG: hypothetical protein HW421_693 [Ignavibacteria bacterium]|nr:hypothetical protein [Ignavibacteria bacterium]
MGLENIDKIINDKFKVRRDNTGKLILEEKKEKKFPKTKITTSGQLILYKFENGNILPFLKDSSNIKSLSDYVLFIEHNDKLFIFIIELSMKRKKEYQNESTQLLMDYIIRTSDRINKTKENVIYKYILLTSKVIKGNTKVKLQDKYNIKAGNELNLKDYCMTS